jgi:hypothetical protein
MSGRMSAVRSPASNTAQELWIYHRPLDNERISSPDEQYLSLGGSRIEFSRFAGPEVALVWYLFDSCVLATVSPRRPSANPSLFSLMAAVSSLSLRSFLPSFILPPLLRSEMRFPCRALTIGFLEQDIWTSWTIDATRDTLEESLALGSIPVDPFQAEAECD